MFQKKIINSKNLKQLKKTPPTFSTIPSPISPNQYPPKVEELKLKFKDMRVFQNHPYASVLNLYFCNKIVQNEWLVKNSEKLYVKSVQMLGSYFTNSFVERTVGKVYTGGDNYTNTDKVYENLQNKNVGMILAYSDEASLFARNEAVMDFSTEQFIASIKHGQQLGSKIAIKYSGIICMKALKELNTYKRFQNKIFEEINVTKDNETFYSGNDVYNQLLKSGIECSKEEFITFAIEILEKQNVNSLDQIRISRAQWETLVHPFYIIDKKNSNSIIQKMVDFDADTLQKIKNFKRRLDDMFIASKEQPESRILVDAEQSYVQYAIESITHQYQLIYNKEEPLLYNTIQCYLKDSQDKVYMEMERAKEFGLKVGIKFVKGAYLNEESQLEDKDNLHEGYDKTQENYTQVAKLTLNLFRDGDEALFGIHNMENVEEIKEHILENGFDKKRIEFGQLLGMADYITYSLAKEGFKTNKYVPYGQTDIMIPYLCRRAYEGFKFMTTSKFQEDLLLDEIKQRFFRKQQ